MKNLCFTLTLVCFAVAPLFASHCHGDVLVNEDFTTDVGVLSAGGGGALAATSAEGVLSHAGVSGFISAASPLLTPASLALGGELIFSVDLVGPGGDRTTENRYLQVNVDGGNFASNSFGGIDGPASLSLSATIAPGTTSVETFFIVHNGFGPANGTGNLAIIDNYRVEFNPVPEPGSLVLLGMGGLTLLRRRK